MITSINVSTPILTTYIDHNLSDEALNWCNTFTDKQNHSSNIKAAMSSWSVYTEVDYFNKLLKEISNALWFDFPYMDEIKNGDYKQTDFAFTSAWVARYEQGEQTNMHDHHPNFISFVYYIQAEPQCAPLIFEDNLAVHPESNLLVVFPSCVRHHVPTITNDKKRIVLAGNVLYVKNQPYEVTNK